MNANSGGYPDLTVRPNFALFAKEIALRAIRGSESDSLRVFALQACNHYF